MIANRLEPDIEALEAEGVKLTPREIVRLNAIALRAEYNMDSAAGYILPRVAFLGDIAFREPTVGMELWVEDVGRSFDMNHWLTYLGIWGIALTARDADELPNPLDADAVREAMDAFLARVSKFTYPQIANCISYARVGNDATINEVPDDPRKDDDGEPSEGDVETDDIYSPSAGIIHEAHYYNLSIPLSDARKMTRAQMDAAISSFCVHNHINRAGRSSEDYNAGYARTLMNIRAKHLKENNNG